MLDFYLTRHYTSKIRNSCCLGDNTTISFFCFFFFFNVVIISIMLSIISPVRFSVPFLYGWRCQLKHHSVQRGWGGANAVVPARACARLPAGVLASAIGATHKAPCTVSWLGAVLRAPSAIGGAVR